jgi:glycine cleavage system aminomethyltransferase T
VETVMIGKAPTEHQTIGGSEVPWIQTSYEDDYLAIRHGAALIDLSGASLISVTGTGALPMMQRLFSRDVAYLTFETSTMGLFLDEDGHVIDISTVYRVDGGFWVETSVGNGDRLQQHFRENADPNVELGVVDRLIFDVEGPQAWQTLDSVVDEPASGLPFQGVRATTAAGCPVLVSRSGFTGEFGAKLLVAPSDGPQVWEALAASATPAGHRALETAMLEVRQPVLHRETTGDPSVGAAAYNWLVDHDKEEFLGHEHVLPSIQEPASRTLCFVTDAEVASGSEVATTDRTVGSVVFAAYSPGAGRHIGIARVTPEVAASGLTFGVRTADGLVPAPSTSSPIVVPSSWQVVVAQ